MIRFRRRLFPKRHYSLPIKWVMLAVMAGLLVLVLWVVKTFFR